MVDGLKEGRVRAPGFGQVLGRAEDERFDLFDGHACAQRGDEAGFTWRIGRAMQELNVESVHELGSVFGALFNALHHLRAASAPGERVHPASQALEG